MATSSADSALAFGATTIDIAPGQTNAAYFPIETGLEGRTIHRIAGGSLLLIPTETEGAESGVTYLATAPYFLFPSILESDLRDAPGSMYLAAGGATTTVSVLSYFSAGSK